MATKYVASIAGPDGRIILDNIKNVAVYSSGRAGESIEITLTEKQLTELRKNA